MRAVLKLEFIGENYHAYKRSGKFHEPAERYGKYLSFDQSRPWVKQVSGYDEDTLKFTGESVRGQIDYSRANSTGSRGIYLYYPLRDGIYEVNERETWKRTRRYFLLVMGTEMVEIERKEVEDWLQQQQKEG